MTEQEQRQISDKAATQVADTVKTGLRSLTPASTGWILAVVLIIVTIQVSEYFSSVRLADFLSSHQEHQTAILQAYIASNGEQSRRYQETIRELTDAVIRDSERAGRAALSAIDRSSTTAEEVVRDRSENR